MVIHSRLGSHHPEDVTTWQPPKLLLKAARTGTGLQVKRFFVMALIDGSSFAFQGDSMRVLAYLSAIGGISITRIHCESLHRPQCDDFLFNIWQLTCTKKLPPRTFKALLEAVEDRQIAQTGVQAEQFDQIRRQYTLLDNPLRCIVLEVPKPDLF